MTPTTLKPNVICHAPGDQCCGCPHYQGKADACAYAPTTPPPQAVETAIACFEEIIAQDDQHACTARVGLEALRAELTRPQEVAAIGDAVAWRHNKTHGLYEDESDVPLGDGDEWAEPLYLHSPTAALAWQAGFLAGDDWRGLVTGYYEAGNHGAPPESPENPYTLDQFADERTASDQVNLATCGRDGVPDCGEQGHAEGRCGNAGCLQPAPQTGDATRLLHRALKQLDRWSEKYGEWQPNWLPPAGDVDLAEDIEEYIAKRSVPQSEGYRVVASRASSAVSAAPVGAKLYTAPPSTAPLSEQPGGVIAAAEKFAANYDGDDRVDIKTDVLNAFYAGSKFAAQTKDPGPAPVGGAS